MIYILKVKTRKTSSSLNNDAKQEHYDAKLSKSNTNCTRKEWLHLQCSNGGKIGPHMLVSIFCLLYFNSVSWMFLRLKSTPHRKSNSRGNYNDALEKVGKKATEGNKHREEH